MCMRYATTNEEKKELMQTFKKNMNDIIQNRVDASSTNTLLSSRGVADSDGHVKVEVDHLIAKAAIKQNNKQAREAEKEAAAILKEKNRVDREAATVVREEKKAAEVIQKTRNKKNRLARQIGLKQIY
jgi:SET domain-containing protein